MTIKIMKGGLTIKARTERATFQIISLLFTTSIAPAITHPTSCLFIKPASTAMWVSAIDGPAFYGPTTKIWAAGTTAAKKKKIACTIGIPVVLGKLVLRGRTEGTAVGIRSWTMVVGEAKDKTRGGAIRDLVDALGDARDKIRGVEPSVDASNTMVARVIKGSNVLDTSSRDPTWVITWRGPAEVRIPLASCICLVSSRPCSDGGDHPSLRSSIPSPLQYEGYPAKWGSWPGYC